MDTLDEGDAEGGADEDDVISFRSLLPCAAVSCQSKTPAGSSSCSSPGPIR